MTNEEKQAKLAAVTSIEEAYALAKECGFPGTVEDFKAECAKAAGNGEQMDLDAMDSVAGGLSLGDVLNWITKPMSEKFGYKEPEHTFDDKPFMPLQNLDPLRDVRELFENA